MSLSDERCEENDSEELDSITFQKIHEKAEKIGYADGIASGNDSVFQLGFDKGYADGLYTGFNLEKYRAFFESVLHSKTAPTNFKKEAIIYEAMNISETTKSEHFQYTKYQHETIEDISKHQKSYVDQTLQQFDEKLENTSNLFCLKN